jgi:hypothetical protein
MIGKILKWLGFGTKEERTVIIRPPRRRRMVSAGIGPTEEPLDIHRGFYFQGDGLTDYSSVGIRGEVNYEQAENRERINERRAEEKDEDEGVLKKLKDLDSVENWDESDLENPYGRSGLRIGDFR